MGAGIEIIQEHRQIAEQRGGYSADSRIFIKISVAAKHTIKELSGTELKVWLFISLHIGEDRTAYPSLDTIAEGVGVSRQTVLTALERLEERGWIVKDAGGGRGNPNVYTITRHASFGKGQEIGQNRENSQVPDDKQSNPPEKRVKPTRREEEPDKKNQLKNNNGTSPAWGKHYKDHPAILEYRKHARLWPPVAFRPKMVEEIGEEVHDWGKLVLDWVGHGWNPSNVKGMLDAYKSGGIRKRGTKSTAKERLERRLEKI